jgi:hypothetical protein
MIAFLFALVADDIGPTPRHPAPLGYVCRKAVAAPRVDGLLDDAAWKLARWTGDFVDIEGSKRPRPRFRTRAKMLWDDTYLYVAAEMEEPHVWATLTEHDSVIFRDNDFEVFIDPDGDNHQYYEIEVNALATEWDLLLVKPYKDGGPAVNGWEIPGLKVATHVQGTLNNPNDVDRGWTIEIAFPWKTLAECAHRDTPPKPGDQWRINFSRVEWRVDVVDGQYRKQPNKPEDNWVWSPQGVIDMHRPERWGIVQFSTDDSAFRPDAAQSVRDDLHEVYYAQRAHFLKEGRYASKLSVLGLSRLAKTIRLSVFAGGFEASCLGPGRRWFIREDSRIGSDPSVSRPRS